MKNAPLLMFALLGMCMASILVVFAVQNTMGKRGNRDYILASPNNYMRDFPPQNPDGSINLVVEIPAGTNDKWEVKPDSGVMKWTKKDGSPRVVKYIGYVGNYGMVPQTINPHEYGGDGEPLDVMALGPSQDRGAVVKAWMVGVLKMQDDGEQDDKIIAVLDESPLGEVRTIGELEEKYPGAVDIVKTFFLNYKAPSDKVIEGVGDEQEAFQLLSDTHQAYMDGKH
ncbi:MAG: inorganic diphosphatase [bacterium]|nr:inorganic diphosphatase [bacterium]